MLMAGTACALVLGLPGTCRAQEAATPITAANRVEWVNDSIIGRWSLAAGVLVAGSQTAFDLPPEWHRSAGGFVRRYIARDAAIATSNSIEAGLGAMWAEDPRYFKCQCDGIKSRVAHAATFAVLAQRSDGHLAPAWGRYAGTMTSSIVQNAWLPPSARGWQQTILREATAFSGRFVGNLWSEFWPEVARSIRH